MARSDAGVMDYLERLAQPSAMQLARMGDFRAIAYWLNASLVPHGIYARVDEARPGTLLVLLEFLRLPRRDRLNDLVCHRLCRLHSPLIRGVRILARFANQSEILWDTSIRLVLTGQSRVAAPPRRQRPRVKKQLKSAAVPVAALPAAAAPATKRRRVRRRKPTTARHAVSRQPKVAPLAVRRSPRRAATHRPPFRPTPHQLKLLGSSAAAIFLLGCGIELWQQADVGVLLQDWQQGRTSIRTALGRVPVIEAESDADNPTVTLTFTGGSTLHAATAADADSTASTNTNGSEVTGEAEAAEPFTMPLQERPLPQADVTLANMPHPLVTDTEAAEATTQRVHAAQNAQISLVNLSGQPATEADAAAIQDTLDRLQQSGMHTVGAGGNAREARQPEIVEVRGKRIAYLGYADGRSPQDGAQAVNPVLQEQVAEDIQAVRGRVDWVIVNYHWTQDIASYPEPWQMELARSAIDQGADLVVGYHPDVLQGAEIYQGRAIAYSLGNFIFEDQASSDRSDYDSAVLKVSLNDNRMRLEFLPVEVQNQQAAIATGKRAEEIRTYLSQASALFDKPLQSPMILDRLALDPNQPVSDDSFDTEATIDPAAVPTDRDGFITYPENAPSTAPASEATPEQPFTSPTFTAPSESLTPDKAEPKPTPAEDEAINNGGWYDEQPTVNPTTESEPSSTDPEELDTTTQPQSAPERPSNSGTTPDATNDTDSKPDPSPNESANSADQSWLPDAEILEESDTVPEETDKSLDAVL
ncbi:MAG: CapA family protein [Cyanobacteria bacterium J06638_20]